MYKVRTRGVHFTILLASPCAAEFYDIWHTKLTHQLKFKFLVNRFKGYIVLSDTPNTQWVTLSFAETKV